MAREVGMSIFVIQHRRYPRNMARRAVQVVQNAGGKLLGIVVNNVQLGHDETYYYYHDQVENYKPLPAREIQLSRRQSHRTVMRSIYLENTSRDRLVAAPWR